MVPDVFDPMGMARRTLRQVEVFVPKDAHERKMKRINLQQLRSFLGETGEARPSRFFPEHDDA
jgi:hypothetical protein